MLECVYGVRDLHSCKQKMHNSTVAFHGEMDLRANNNTNHIKSNHCPLRSGLCCVLDFNIDDDNACVVVVVVVADDIPPLRTGIYTT